MINKLIKKIGFICLGFACLALAGCFHVPDEDWLPNRNKIKTGNAKKENEVDDAINHLIDGINIISSERNDLKDNKNNNEENNENNTENLGEINIERENSNTNDEDATNDKDKANDEDTDLNESTNQDSEE